MMGKATSARGTKTIRDGWQLFKNRRTLGCMFREVFSRKYRMSLFTNLVLVFGILYVLFPFDLVSDFIPFAGWLDDGFVIFLVIKRLQRETQRFNRYKAMERRR